ncbi:hypothetical protein PYK79_52885 [Streptomyces sp. ID05-04B]|uniref:hypothetical protein n=1 Tax=Streptomyces sp. ID05-04B TaxID=3028661 RepID=UPI0029C46530|nr:hypothetical protein [Streptomyces sp. ID05-04B]MDX5570260.1 hypothetical protein [Streptomyces sp. ID05-04B]
MERTQPSPQPEGARRQSTALARHGRATASVETQVRTWLGEIADRLERNRPAAELTAVARIAVLQATTLDPVLGRALRIAAPEVDQPVTRRAYAARLRAIAAGTPTEPSLLEQYAAATARCREIAKEIGHRDCDTHPRWRTADRAAESLWKQALAAGHTADELTAASRAQDDA